ncbi:LiaF transmembrane domain-containing protein [Daejeonella oryzae]|uniref:LiaF transmembrane domain-containing protein n=1 Tax=Daejeonella oryzae TaxID=1122943 RepID=UPI00041AED6A|nr:DUF5668 domain-containing protein [Daejeonella oryzae]
MKTEKIVWGLLFVFIGAIFLLDNYNVIDFYWRSVWRLWPLMFIVIGTNMLFNKDDNKYGPIIAGLITLFALALITYQGTRPLSEQHKWSFKYDTDDEENNSSSDKDLGGANLFSEPFSASTSRAELNIKGGATSYNLNDTTSNLFDASVSQNSGAYTLEKSSRDSMEILTFRMRDRKGNWNMKGMDGNDADLKLNTKPVWNINLEMGAGTADFDLTAFKINDVKLKGGAASFKIKMPEPLTISNVDVETGVAEVEISIPTSAGCRIKVETGLSSRDFSGFTKQSDGSYITSNYDSSAKKIMINLKGGLSEFNVNRY